MKAVDTRVTCPLAFSIVSVNERNRAYINGSSAVSLLSSALLTVQWISAEATQNSLRLKRILRRYTKSKNG